MPPFDELDLEWGAVKARIAPKRGALVTHLEVDGRSVLYLDRETFEDDSKNVRGGIPILFPFAGILENNILQATGTAIPQHGFARNHPWEVDEIAPGRMRLYLDSDEATIAVFPWDFRIEQTCLLTARGIHLEMLVHNLDMRPMPLAPGWHPYFRCPADLKSGVQGDVPGFNDHGLNDTDTHDFSIQAPAHSRGRFDLPGTGSVRLSFSPQMRHIQVWSLPGRDFVCIEPFTGPSNLINTNRAIEVPAGEARTFWMRIELCTS